MKICEQFKKNMHGFSVYPKTTYCFIILVTFTHFYQTIQTIKLNSLCQ